MSNVLEFADVTLTRSGSHLLDKVTWTVADGQRWVVLGPNGAGKTTLLQIAATNMHPSSGQAAVLGELLGAVDVFELRPRIGLTTAALSDRIRSTEWVLDVVRTAAYGVVGRWRESYEDVDDARAFELLYRLGISHLAGRTFGTLSEGERKRTQIARAMMSDPELLLLDEPSAGLDLGGRESLVTTLGGIATDPLSPATVLVTHHVEEIPAGITHAMLLRAGRVVAAGPVDETLTAENLSSCFGLSLSVSHENGRWSARATS
ncbi:ABC transporter ATP-binding protein [Phytoactinopolyspora endophytica]|uniref:ABC transporter ATP-binding protein n=1 Tax=Phytoactinopolyspora endophytica TaxID=1642495 RepID=UPI00101D3DA9|nr:ABC transporter ATP-binding protein [Phytoactinopolyspora endophytica]